MIGKFLSKATKVVTSPLDIIESGVDFATGGDGSREELKDMGVPMPSDLRDAVCNIFNDIDED